MQELFKTLEILESILKAENPIQEARKQRKSVLAEIKALEDRMYSDFIRGEASREDEVL